jgi:glycosyltransferase involved in cell wall biosynthesis
VINLSFIISTRNRLPYLKITLGRLIETLGKDEEVIVVDGDSEDGTKEYLSDLFKYKKIQQFISEPDKNQAHGWNKAMLLAKGLIIKKIIDDDVFDYNSIRICKNYLLSNPKIDVLISNDLSASIFNPEEINKNSRLTQFKNWAKGGSKSFTFGDVHMLIRKSSLSFLGLYNAGYIMMDWEYALRISYLRAHIVYYTGYNALSVAHPNTITSTQTGKEVENQSKKALIFYDYEGDHANISYWSKFKIFLGKTLFTQRHNKKGFVPVAINNELAYELLYKSILELNAKGSFTFLDSKKID